MLDFPILSNAGGIFRTTQQNDVNYLNLHLFWKPALTQYWLEMPLFQVCVSKCPTENELGVSRPASEMICKEGTETVTEVCGMLILQIIIIMQWQNYIIV